MHLLRRSCATLAIGFLLCLPVSALATPVLHTVDATLSNLSGDVSGTIAIAVHTNLGTVNGNANAAGALGSSNESGSVNLEWGDPVWNSQLDVAAGDATFNTGPMGAVPGSAVLDLFGFIPVNFNLSINVDFIELTFQSPFSGGTVPADPGSAQSGPWAAADTNLDIGLGAQIDFTGTGPFGITLANNNIGIGPSTINVPALLLNLERLGGVPGTGSQVGLPIPTGLSLNLPPQPTANFSVPGCEVDASLACALNVTSIDVTLTSLTFSNLSGNLVANQTGTVVPEPGVLGLVALGLLGLGVAARRGRA